MASLKCNSWCYGFFLLLVTVIIAGERTKDKMFEPITGGAACFRRLNGTHQVGCASSRSGNVGVIHVIETEEDLTWLLENGVAGPYMAVVHPAMFTREVMTSLKASGKLSGTLLVNNGSLDRPRQYSPEDVCPNRYSGLSTLKSQTCNETVPWNPLGAGLLQVDWGFPIFHVREPETIDKVYECFEKHNAHDRDSQKARALCALEMNAFMFAAVDSATCMRRSHLMTNLNPVRYCDPLGDRNVWSTLFGRSKSVPAERNASLVVLAARLDSTSMFDDVVPGAITPTAGIVALLATANLLAQMLPSSEANNDTNVLFLLLNGESYDYIGSSRLVYDMRRGEFPSVPDAAVPEQPPPIFVQNISLFVELSQLSGSESNTVFLHKAASNNVRTRSQLSEFVSTLQSIGAAHGLSFASSDNSTNLPPASLQTFLREDPDLPGVILADHGPQFTNKYYHSLFDDSEQLEYVYGNGSELSKDSIQVFIANISTTLAKTVYKLITDKNYSGQHGSANLTMVDELFHCYLDTMNCSLFHAATPHPNKLPDKPAALYVGVSVNNNIIPTLTAQVLAFLTGEKTNVTSEKECRSDPGNQVYQNLWMSSFKADVGNDTGICVRTTMNYSAAVSPAFVVDGYDWKSGRYSTWTESIWLSFSVRMFLKPSAAHEVLTLSVGIVVLVLSFLVVFFVDNKSAVLFGNTLGGC